MFLYGVAGVGRGHTEKVPRFRALHAFFARSKERFQIKPIPLDLTFYLIAAAGPSYVQAYACSSQRCRRICQYDYQH